MSADPLAHLADPAGLGVALDRAFARFGGRVAAIEGDRDRENARLTYSDLGGRVARLAGFLAARGFKPGDRAAIVMSNQWKWHAYAAAVFRLGGTLVPLDFKLSGPEQVALLAHCRAKVLASEWHLLRAMAQDEGFAELPLRTVIATDVPDGQDIAAPTGAEPFAFDDAEGMETPPAVPRGDDDVACIVYSSGTGGRPKGCLLTHGNYLSQFRALAELHPMDENTRYLSILPTNHAIDFMVGFLGPYFCGATVVHLRTLRPEFVKAAFPKYKITHMALVPMVLGNLENGLRQRIDELPPLRKAAFHVLRRTNGLLSGGKPNPKIARKLLGPIHQGFGGRLEALFVGGAYTNPSTLRFFHDLGIPVANGYGLTEAGTAVTLDRLNPPRPDSVGVPLPGVEIDIADPDPEGVGEIRVKSDTIMAGYLDDPQLTAESFDEGWLRTGDLGRLVDGSLQIMGRRKNMIVTAGGKNVYPEDVEVAYAGLPAKEICIFAAHYLWPEEARDERLVLVLRRDPDRPESDEELVTQVAERNRRVADYKRVAGVILWDQDFPRTASMKIKRPLLAEQLTAQSSPDAILPAS